MLENKKFSDKLINFFESIDSKTLRNEIVEIKDSITCSFVNGPFVEILGDSGTEYTIEFVDLDHTTVIHRDVITPNHWVRASRQWATNWKINIYSEEKLIYEHIFNPTNKKVYVHLSSESIGDTLAWFPYIEEFRKKYDCEMICSTFHNNLFEEIYTNIRFVKPGTTLYDLYAMFEIGIYDGDFDRNKNDHKKIPLQQVASDMLGLEFKEIRPDIKLKKSEVKIPGKYVAIATESTSQCKLWNYPDGWQKVVNYLNDLGYKVVVVQKKSTNLKNVIHKTGNKDLNSAIDIINNSEFFIGLSSGLSWIAWALKKKHIMISGFTLPWYEYNENCYRIYNIHSCKGCWHEHEFDKGDWNWCPMKKNFECSSTITPDSVYSQIQTIINEYDDFYTTESTNKKVNLTNKIIGFEFNNPKYKDAENMFYEIFRNRNYDFNKCRVFKGDIVVDIGANIGIFTKYALANGAKRVYSYEPIRSNYDILVKNTNGYEVITDNIGISDICKTEIFHIDSNSGGHTLLDIDPNKTRTEHTEEVKCYSLDYMFGNKSIPDQIDFMKIDAEGAEIKILSGISDENLLKVNKFAIEWHQFIFDNKNTLNSVIDRFSSLKYHFYIDHTGPDLMIIYFWKE